MNSEEIVYLLKLLAKQNETLIHLIAKGRYTEDEVKKIITYKKINPKNYLRGYNALDGTKSLSEVAKIIGVKAPTLSPILKEWEEKGIIYEVLPPKGKTGKFYKKIFSVVID